MKFVKRVFFFFFFKIVVSVLKNKSVRHGHIHPVARSTESPHYQFEGGQVGPEARGSRAHRQRGPRPGLPIAESVQHAVHVILTTQPLKEGDEVQQLCVRHVIEPRLHRHCILRMEDV